MINRLTVKYVFLKNTYWNTHQYFLSEIHVFLKNYVGDPCSAKARSRKNIPQNPVRMALRASKLCMIYEYASKQKAKALTQMHMPGWNIKIIIYTLDTRYYFIINYSQFTNYEEMTIQS